MGALLPAVRQHPDWSNAGPNVDTVAPKGDGECLRTAGMVVWVDALVWRDQDRWHAVAGIHLGHLHAGWTGTQHDEALRQLAGRCRLSVRPWPDLVEARDVVGDRRARAYGDDGRPDEEGPFAVL